MSEYGEGHDPSKEKFTSPVEAVETIEDDPDRTLTRAEIDALKLAAAEEAEGPKITSTMRMRTEAAVPRTEAVVPRTEAIEPNFTSTMGRRSVEAQADELPATTPESPVSEAIQKQIDELDATPMTVVSAKSAEAETAAPKVETETDEAQKAAKIERDMKDILGRVDEMLAKSVDLVQGIPEVNDRATGQIGGVIEQLGSGLSKLSENPMYEQLRSAWNRVNSSFEQVGVVRASSRREAENATKELRDAREAMSLAEKSGGDEVERVITEVAKQTRAVADSLDKSQTAVQASRRGLMRELQTLIGIMDAARQQTRTDNERRAVSSFIEQGQGSFDRVRGITRNAEEQMQGATGWVGNTTREIPKLSDAYSELRRRRSA